MSPDTLYTNVTSSVIKFSEDFRLSQTVMATSQYYDFDAHSQQPELPAENLIGPAGFGLAHEEDFIHLAFSIGVVTHDDPNLFKLRKVMGQLYAKLQPETKLPIYDDETGQQVSWMVLKTPVEITPVTKAELRSVQFINVSAIIDPGATSSLR